MIAYEFRFTILNAGAKSFEIINVMGGPGTDNELRAAGVAGRRLAERLGNSLEVLLIEMRKRSARDGRNGRNGSRR